MTDDQGGRAAADERDVPGPFRPVRGEGRGVHRASLLHAVAQDVKRACRGILQAQTGFEVLDEPLAFTVSSIAPWRSP